MEVRMGKGCRLLHLKKTSSPLPVRVISGPLAIAIAFNAAPRTGTGTDLNRPRASDALLRVEHELDLAHCPQQVLHAPEQFWIPGDDGAGRLFHGMAYGGRREKLRVEVRHEVAHRLDPLLAVDRQHVRL